MRFVGIEAVTYGVTNLPKARQFWADFGLEEKGVQHGVRRLRRGERIAGHPQAPRRQIAAARGGRGLVRPADNLGP